MSKIKASYDQNVDVSRIGEHGKVDLNVSLLNRVLNRAPQENLTSNRQDPVRRPLLLMDVQDAFIEGVSFDVLCSTTELGKLRDSETDLQYVFIDGVALDVHCSTTEFGKLQDSETDLQKLEDKLKKLGIWPHHCIHATEEVDLENEFVKMFY